MYIGCLNCVGLEEGCTVDFPYFQVCTDKTRQTQTSYVTQRSQLDLFEQLSLEDNCQAHEWYKNITLTVCRKFTTANLA